MNPYMVRGSTEQRIFIRGESKPVEPYVRIQVGESRCLVIERRGGDNEIRFG